MKAGSSSADRLQTSARNRQTNSFVNSSAHNGAWFSYECAAAIKERRSLSEPSALTSQRPDRRLFASATWKPSLLVSSRVGFSLRNTRLSRSGLHRFQKIHRIVRTGRDRETRARKRWHQGGARSEERRVGKECRALGAA